MVVLIRVPSGFTDDLPKEDQKAIPKLIGKPAELVGYDTYGRAELEYVESNESGRTIWVKPSFIRRVK
jgi:hypothetical protein